MSVHIDKTIHRIETNNNLYLGRMGEPGKKNVMLLERVDYRLHADKMPFLFLGIPYDTAADADEDDEEEITSQKKEFHLSWDTSCNPKSFYVPSFRFHETVYTALGGKEEGSVRVQEWGKNFLKRDYSLKEYLQVNRSIEHFLDYGFTQKQGLISVRTDHYALLLGHYSRRKRITVFMSEDLSDALGPLVRATSRLHFNEDDDERLTSAITYFLNETIFEQTHH